MADEDVTLDGKPLNSLRVADLKAALEQRNLPKSGQKNALIKRLKGALMLENLQRSSSSHIGLQPNSQIGEEMSQNSFIKQYLAKQQELLRQRLEREAQQAAEADESPAAPEDEDDHSEANDSNPFLVEMHRPMPSQPPLTRAEEEGAGPLMGQGMLARRPDFDSGSIPHQESPDMPGSWLQRPSLQPGHEEPTTPSPPRAVASLSVRVLGQPERQGLPPAMPRSQEKEGTAPTEPGSAHSVLHLSRSARAAAGANAQEDSDEDDEDDDDESEEDDEWGPGAGGARRGGRAPPQPQQPSPSVPAAAVGRERSRRKLQPPQHIPPPQVHQPPMQLRQPTPPPSPPPELSFPLPDTPKQSPPDMDEPEGAGPGAGVAARPPPAMQRQDSDSSSRSSSPEPNQQRRPGPLSLLARKMESEGGFPATEPSGAVDMSGGKVRCASNNATIQSMEREKQMEKQKEEAEEKLKKEQEEKEKAKKREEEMEKERKREEEIKKKQEEEKEKERKREEEKEKERKRLEVAKEVERKRVEEEEKKKKEEEKEKEKERESRLPPWKRGRDLTSPSHTTAVSEVPSSQTGSEDSPMGVSSTSLPTQPAMKAGFLRDASPQQPPSSPPPGSATTTPSSATKKPRMFSDTHTGSLVSPPKPSVVVIKARDSESSSDSDSGSDSSSRSSGSSLNRDKSHPKKKAGQPKEIEDEKRKRPEQREDKRFPTRDMSQPSATAVMDPDSESSMTQPAAEADPDSNGGRMEEVPMPLPLPLMVPASYYHHHHLLLLFLLHLLPRYAQAPRRYLTIQYTLPCGWAIAKPVRNQVSMSTTPKAFAACKISITTGSKTSPVSAEAGGETETGGAAAARKRRWGSSTAVTAKKPSISITTDSLKSLIPDIKVSQEAVVELHPEDVQLSGDEDSQGLDLESREDQGLDKGLKIRRTVTQVVSGDGQENGQKMDEDDGERPRRTSKDKRKSSHSEEAMETQPSIKPDGEAKKVTPSDSLVRRSISQQKSGVSITIDDPVRTAKQPSPPRGKTSCIVHVTNLVRPFTLGQLKELLNRTGNMVEEGFWIDKIKSHCFVTYATTEEAIATRTALHGVKWPQSNPKVLGVDFCEQEEVDFHKGLLKAPERGGGEEERSARPGAPQARPGALPPLMGERERPGVVGVRDQWAEREREMERRERTRAEREWDRDKIRDFGRPGEEGQRSRSRERERRRKERGKSKERKTDKKVTEKADEPPAKLLDDLFQKTKAAPCIYWLPLTEEQAAQRVLERSERQKEREKRRKEQQEEEDKKREEERKERIKGREKEVGAPASTGNVGRGAEGDKDRERDRDRERERDRDGEKKRDGYKPKGPSGGFGAGRRSRSRSNPRDRRR
ncbi:apoptotic chromatin condensation inducer 1b [Aplochiton taeniatus]